MIGDPDDSEISPDFLSKFSRNMKGPISCPLWYSSVQMLTTNPEFVSQEFIRIRKAASFSFQKEIQDWLLASDEQDTFVDSSFKVTSWRC